MEPRSDRIELRGLRVMTVVGVLPEERERPQPVELDLDLLVDLSRAGVSDDLSATIDYAAVCDAAVELLGSTWAGLLERLATDVAETVLALDARIEAVEVAVRKLHPPVPHALDTSGVRILRRAGTGPQGG
jgi:FolB domain-containing protein